MNTEHPKTDSDFVSRIYTFNKDNNLLEKGYSDFLESAFQIEEALEGFDIKSLSQNCTDYILSTESPKELARYIVDGETFLGTDVDRLDKACDAIVFAVGSMAKLGLTPSQIHEALHIVMDANTAKTGCPKDAAGKLMKPDNFPNPEPKLQAILNRRSE